MKLIDRERIEGTCVTIGRRVYYENKQQKAGRRYAAEYRNLEGAQVCESLGTTSRVQARRKAFEIQQRLERGTERPREIDLSIEQLADAYLEMVEAKDVAPKTEAKYRADLEKLKAYGEAAGLGLARQFSEEDLYRYRRWLSEQGYADKTVQGAVVVAKQVFKWAWRQGMLRD